MFKKLSFSSAEGAKKLLLEETLERRDLNAFRARLTIAENGAAPVARRA